MRRKSDAPKWNNTTTRKEHIKQKKLIIKQLTNYIVCNTEITLSLSICIFLRNRVRATSILLTD